MSNPTSTARCSRGVKLPRTADAGDRYKTDRRRESQGNTISGNPRLGSRFNLPSQRRLAQGNRLSAEQISPRAMSRVRAKGIALKHQTTDSS